MRRGGDTWEPRSWRSHAGLPEVADLFLAHYIPDTPPRNLCFLGTEGQWALAATANGGRELEDYPDVRCQEQFRHLWEVDRNPKRAVPGERGEPGGAGGGAWGRIVGNCQPNGASGARIGGAVAAKRAGFGVGTIGQ